MGIILDTSILVAAERRRFDLTGFLLETEEQTVTMAAISVSELLHGLERAVGQGIKERRQAFVDAMLRETQVASFGLSEARHHARIWAALAVRGEMIGMHDLQIAATALSLGFDLATLNRKEFQRVPELKLLPTEKFLMG
jgi:tRNA(fMet)-specific endonuclease VapC